MWQKIIGWYIAAKMWLRLWWFFRWHTINEFERRLIWSGLRPQIKDNARVYHLPGGGVVTIKDLTIEVKPVKNLNSR